jgi:hypothetical protein
VNDDFRRPPPGDIAPDTLDDAFDIPSSDISCPNVSGDASGNSGILCTRATSSVSRARSNMERIATYLNECK